MKKMIYSSSEPVVAAEESEVLDDAISELKANFDYVVEGFEKLGRNGKEGQNTAQQILLQLSASVEDAVRGVAEAFTGGSSAEPEGGAE